MKKKLVFYCLTIILLACKENPTTELDKEVVGSKSQEAIKQLDEKMNKSESIIRESLNDIEEQLENKKGGFKKFKKDSNMQEANITIEEYKE